MTFLVESQLTLPKYLRTPPEWVAISKTREISSFHFCLLNHGHLNEECMAVFHGKSSKFQLYNLLSWCVAQEHFYMQAGVHVNISWGFFFFNFTYIFVKFVYSQLISRGESDLAIYGTCKFFELAKGFLEISHSFLSWASKHMYPWNFLMSFIALTGPSPLKENGISRLQKASKFSPISEGQYSTEYDLNLSYM